MHNSSVLHSCTEASLEVLKAVAEQGGYMYEDLPSVLASACGNLEPADLHHMLRILSLCSDV